MPSEIVVKVDTSGFNRTLAKFERDPEAYVADRRLQVIARLLDAVGMIDTDAAELVAVTRDEYPDVFADVERYRSAFEARKRIGE